MNDLPEYYTEETIVTDKFLFVSYSHEDKDLVRNSANWLINEGVRLWYDADLHNGDNWIEIAKRIVLHENCIGVIFFNSSDSYISDPVSKERELALQKKKEWEKEEKFFHTFAVNIGKPSTLRLIKQVLDMQPDNDAIIRKAFTSSQLSVILELFDDMRIYSFADMDNGQGFLQPFFDDISKRAPEVINKATIAIEEMEKISKNSGISFKLGKYQINGETETLEWQFIGYNQNEGAFLLRQVLDPRYGNNLSEWLNNEFKTSAFTEEERLKIIGEIRLLFVKEAEEISVKLMQTEHSWWLADVKGALQTVVREDGTIYLKGSINNRFQRGVRPVIVVDMNTAKDLMR